jgi:hypothetical protein
MRQITHQHQVDNLLALHDAVPNAVRPRSALWYDGMNSIIQDRAQRYGISQAQAAGNYAGLSPQKDWYMNVGLGDRVADAIFNHGSQVFDPRMVDAYTRFSQVKGKDPAAAAAKTAIHMQAMNELVGRRLDDLDTVDQKARFIKAYDMAYNPRTYNSVMPEGDFGPPIVKGNGEPAKIAWSGYNELGSAVTSLLGTNMPDISNAMGARHKVRFFYNSGMYPNSPLGDYVSDTHDVAARLFRPLSGSTLEVGHNLATRPIKGMVGSADSAVNGFKGTYAFGADAGRDAAAQRGLLPRQMQSISWEGVRGLFPKAYKNDTNKDVVDSIWGRVSDGTLAPQDARQLIMRHAGARGGNNFVPNWFSGRPIVEEGE